MKLLWLNLSLLLVVVAVSAKHDHPPIDLNAINFAEWLKTAQLDHHFVEMTPEEKLLYGELVMAAEQGGASLTALIDRVSLLKILQLMDDLHDEDAVIFEGYLAIHFQHQTNMAAGGTTTVMPTA